MGLGINFLHITHPMTLMIYGLDVGRVDFFENKMLCIYTAYNIIQRRGTSDSIKSKL